MTDSILIIVSDATLRNELISALSEAGFTIAAVPYYSETLLKLDKFKPDMIIMDEALLSIDPVETCYQIRNTLDIPVVLLGEDSSDELWERVLEAGIDHYQIKPFSYISLIARVKAILRRCKVRWAKDLPSRLMLFRSHAEVRRGEVS